MGEMDPDPGPSMGQEYMEWQEFVESPEREEKAVAPRVIPTNQLQRRIPTAGRLRFGIKTGKRNRPKAIDHWRITSHDQEAIEQVAAIYGGEPRPWEDAPTSGQWEVITQASELRIVLPPDPLGNSPIYELWSRGGCQRRCDGVTCVIDEYTGPDEAEPVETDCICNGKGVLECKVKTRLSVILPEIRFAGVWRLDSGSWNVAHEMPGMVELIQSMQHRGLTRGLLALEHRRQISRKQTRRFIVPALRIAGSANELASGDMQVNSLGKADQGRSLSLPPSPNPRAKTSDTVDGTVDTTEIMDDSEPVEITDLELRAMWSEIPRDKRPDWENVVWPTFRDNPGQAVAILISAGALLPGKSS